MEPCSYTSWIGAYVDGELPAHRREELDRHLPHCPACSMEFRELKHLSQLLARPETTPLPRGASRRLHLHVDALGDRSVLRFAQALSGVAAAMLVAASIAGFRRGSPVASEPLLLMQQAAVELRPPPAVESGPLTAAQWIASELSTEQSQ